MHSEEIRDNLIHKARRYCSETGESFSSVGMAAIGDNRFLVRVAEGKGFNINTYQRILDWLDGRQAELDAQASIQAAE